MNVIAPRVPTPTAPETDRPSSRMPDDVVAEQVQRLTLFSVVSGGMWCLALVMDLFVLPRTIGVITPMAGLLTDVVAVGPAVVVFLYVRYSRRAPDVKADVGLWLMLLKAASVVVLERVSEPPTKDARGDARMRLVRRMDERARAGVVGTASARLGRTAHVCREPDRDGDARGLNSSWR